MFTDSGRCSSFCQTDDRQVPPDATRLLGGSGGVAGGAIAFARGFVSVLMMIALAGIIGAALSRGISETA